jgi:hypothetical protein
MLVKELIEKLKLVPQDSCVVVGNEQTMMLIEHVPTPEQARDTRPHLYIKLMTP